MGYLFRLSTLSQSDLRDIWDFISSDSMQAADRVLDRLIDCFQMLAQFPGAGRRRPEWGAGVRSYPLFNLLIVYRATDSGIEVIRVVHGARDPERWLRE